MNHRIAAAWRALRGQPPVLTLAMCSRINKEVIGFSGHPHGGVVGTVVDTLVRGGLLVREPGYWGGVPPAPVADLPWEVLHPRTPEAIAIDEQFAAEQAACSHADIEWGECLDCGAEVPDPAASAPEGER
jgi:hypothetical protein